MLDPIHPVTHCRVCGVTTKHFDTRADAEPVPVLHRQCMDEVQRKIGDDVETFYVAKRRA